MADSVDWSREELEKNYVGKMRAVTVPVNVRFEGTQIVLSLNEMRLILERAEVLALGECGCRRRMKQCDAPLDVCLTLNGEAEDFVAQGLGKEVTKGEALEALKRSHDAGLVHIAYTFKDSHRPDIICSCCSCCCHSMSALVRFGMPEAVTPSKYVSFSNSDTCAACGTCVERCQFKARSLVNGQMIYDKSRCFGCGVCVSSCPTKSISLEERR